MHRHRVLICKKQDDVLVPDRGLPDKGCGGCPKALRNTPELQTVPALRESHALFSRDNDGVDAEKLPRLRRQREALRYDVVEQIPSGFMNLER